MILDYGPEGVWEEHLRRLWSEADVPAGDIPARLRDPLAAAESPPCKARPKLFPRLGKTLGSPGLYRAVIPKLYSLTYWKPRLSQLLLPKYLLALDSRCTAHLYQ
jgi:hypothetical protein